MRVIVAGGRDFANRTLLDGSFDKDWLELCKGIMFEAMLRLYTDFGDPYWTPKKELKVLSGMAPGADTLAIDWCVVNWVAWEEWPADWEKYGKRAGIIRNEAMADNADALVAFWDGSSPGTKHMIGAATRRGLEVHVYPYARQQKIL